MSRKSVVAAGLMVAGAYAQSNFAAEGFEYVGCVAAIPSALPVNIAFFAPFGPQECQRACDGKAHFVGLGDGCHCGALMEGDAAPKLEFQKVDEAKCDRLCVEGDESKGKCGGSEVDGKRFYNLYQAMDCDEYEEEESHPATRIVQGVPPPSAQSTVYKTIIDCLPEVTDCPGQTQVLLCPGAPGCTEPTAAPVPVTHGGKSTCPAEGCPGQGPDDKIRVVILCDKGGCSKEEDGKPFACAEDGCACGPHGEKVKLVVFCGLDGCVDEHGKFYPCPKEGCPRGPHPGPKPKCPPEGCDHHDDDHDDHDNRKKIVIICDKAGCIEEHDKKPFPCHEEGCAHGPNGEKIKIALICDEKSCVDQNGKHYPCPEPKPKPQPKPEPEPECHGDCHDDHNGDHGHEGKVRVVIVCGQEGCVTEEGKPYPCPDDKCPAGPNGEKVKVIVYCDEKGCADENGRPYPCPHEGCPKGHEGGNKGGNKGGNEGGKEGGNKVVVVECGDYGCDKNGKPIPCPPEGCHHEDNKGAQPTPPTKGDHAIVPPPPAHGGSTGSNQCGPRGCDANGKPIPCPESGCHDEPITVSAASSNRIGSVMGGLAFAAAVLTFGLA